MTTERDADAAWAGLVKATCTCGTAPHADWCEARNVLAFRPRLEAALRAQGDSASTPEHVCDYKKLTGYDVDMAQPRYHWAPDGMHLDPVGPYVLRHTVGDSATTEGAVPDVERPYDGHTLPPTRAAILRAFHEIEVHEGSDGHRWVRRDLASAAIQGIALLADVPEEPTVDPRVVEAFDLLGGMWSWHDDPDEPSYLYTGTTWATRAGRVLRDVVGRPAKSPGVDVSGTGAGESQS